MAKEFYQLSHQKQLKILEKNNPLVTEITQTLSINKPLNNKKEHGELYHKKWTDKIKNHAPIESFTEKFSSPVQNNPISR